tara:strand:- start:489 stop:635 length:147 start_codon:yes stop_codon:yes gene_type:complete
VAVVELLAVVQPQLFLLSLVVLDQVDLVVVEQDQHQLLQDLGQETLHQ